MRAFASYADSSPTTTEDASTSTEDISRVFALHPDDVDAWDATALDADDPDTALVLEALTAPHTTRPTIGAGPARKAAEPRARGYVARSLVRNALALHPDDSALISGDAPGRHAWRALAEIDTTTLELMADPGASRT